MIYSTTYIYIILYIYMYIYPLYKAMQRYSKPMVKSLYFIPTPFFQTQAAWCTAGLWAPTGGPKCPTATGGVASDGSMVLFYICLPQQTSQLCTVSKSSPMDGMGQLKNTTNLKNNGTKIIRKNGPTKRCNEIKNQQMSIYFLHKRNTKTMVYPERPFVC